MGRNVDAEVGGGEGAAESFAGGRRCEGLRVATGLVACRTTAEWMGIQRVVLVLGRLGGAETVRMASKPCAVWRVWVRASVGG